MEKKIQETKKTQEPHQTQHQKAKSLVWDCGSTLYDSFELKSLERQLDSAINSRTLSMPHLPDRRIVPPPPPAVSTKKPSNKFSRSVNKFLKTLFRSNKQNSGINPPHDDQYFIIYDKSGALTTIPEVPEIDFGGFSPEFNSLVRKTTSERFTAPIGISCA
ncbi:hypothetical protein Tsubulata_027883 [Turnera subulata]|uniref:Uncharacterized protein n=1 Tax=Turnera subulata TaxID=218843 RepID=A0A9Q0JDW5_9ROSI|nr:hypothetical protein Tsubulata_027883 [Turnera subulata]